ncbi:hypothetical protein ABB37_05786 [Leptomonas pyrrhocoris]|uniref:Uncharacterized protein n=1 Tax=Leptomonas pyrrhocoris TaxID=157538 RepID=A0A0M9FZY4_LEPPY|nr:hypothetical protein ABB37_05786 [Leptomonas pyrrhocoris]KPA79336.1 hypothetical protein ABB37_05786 [Leptomonas pyrrhocoris]|eukprot:XP_015657775.1 hypothetical protein ABB37_05786 [Leptomonas pyrrhocoris]
MFRCLSEKRYEAAAWRERKLSTSFYHFFYYYCHCVCIALFPLRISSSQIYSQKHQKMGLVGCHGRCSHLHFSSNYFPSLLWCYVALCSSVLLSLPYHVGIAIYVVCCSLLPLSPSFFSSVCRVPKRH